MRRVSSVGIDGGLMRTSWVASGISIAVFAWACGTPTSAPVPDGGSLGAVGGACASDLDCRTGLTCFTGAPGARPWPSGYCTRACTMEDCPSGSRCGELYTDDTGATHYSCLATCERDFASAGGCRPGYLCMYDGACHVGCSSDAQCESIDFDQGAPIMHPGSTCDVATGRCARGNLTGGADVGEACTAETDCRGPSAFCNAGRCVRANCDLGGPFACSAGQECIGLRATDFQTLGFCALDCTFGTDGVPGSPGACAPSDACLPAEADDADRATHAYCAPTAGAGMTGDATAHFGGACTTVADCPNPYGLAVCSGGVCQEPFCAAASIASFDLCGTGATCLTLDAPDANDRYVVHGAPLGFCFADCTTDTDCAGGFTCNTGHCTP